MDEFKKLFAELQKAFEEYKEANDARLDELKKGGSGAEFDEKLTRLEKEIQRLEKEKGEFEAKLNTPGFTGGGADKEEKEYQEAFNKFLRKGEVGGLEEKDVNIGTPADGGYAVPTVLGREIYSLLTKLNPMRSLCRVITNGGETYSELVNAHGASAGWVGETTERAKTDTPGLYKVEPVMGEIYANPQSTQRALDDMFFNVEVWLAEEIASTFAEYENAAFITGDGTNKPKGFLTASTPVATADKTRDFGVLQYIKTGVADNFPAAEQPDLLIDVIHALKKGHRVGASWLMNTLTLATIRKWKDATGNYIWQPGLQLGQPSSLFGYPVVEDDEMPSVGANKFPIAFGNFKAGYTIVDRMGVRMLRDPYTAKPNVSFYTTKRVGGFLKDSEAIKLVKCVA